MTNSSGYGDAFKRAKGENQQQQHEGEQARKEERGRAQAEADADAAALSDVVLPELYAAAKELKSAGGQIDIRAPTHAESGRPVSVAFRVHDNKGQASRAYLINPSHGMVAVTSGERFDKWGRPEKAINVSEEVGIERRDDLTVEKVKNLILRAIAEIKRA